MVGFYVSGKWQVMHSVDINVNWKRWGLDSCGHECNSSEKMAEVMPS